VPLCFQKQFSLLGERIGGTGGHFHSSLPTLALLCCQAANYSQATTQNHISHRPNASVFSLIIGLAYPHEPLPTICTLPGIPLQQNHHTISRLG